MHFKQTSEGSHSIRRALGRYQTHSEHTLSPYNHTQTMLRSSTSKQLRQLSTTVSRFPKLSEITSTDLHTTKNPFGHGSYFLERTSLANLPVYTNYRQGIPYTEITKVKGDIVQFRNDLQETLADVPKENFKIVMESKKILIKGWHKEALLSALKDTF